MLSVYIVSTGHHEFLSHALDSVLASGFELTILVIETSPIPTDIHNSELIVKERSLSLLKLSGYRLPEVANHVMGLITTPYLVRLDADDWFARDYLKTVHEAIRNEDFDAYIPSYIETDSEGVNLREVCRQQLMLSRVKDNPPHGACTVFKADFIRSIGGYSTKYDRQDGYYIWLKLLRYGRFTCLPKAKFYYRQHGRNLTGNQRELWNVRAAMLVDECFEELKNDSFCVIPILDLDSAYGKLTLQPFLGYKSLLEYELSRLTVDCTVVVYGPRALRSILPPGVNFVERFIFSHDQWDDIQNEVIDALDVKNGYLCVKNIEYPFVNPRYVEAAISAIHLFGANSCITVQELKKDIYQSSDNGLVKVVGGAVQDSDRRYKRSGGISARRINDGFISADDLVTFLPADNISAIRVSEIKDFSDLKELFK